MTYPTLPTLIALCWAFRDLLGDEQIELSDLFAGNGHVTLSPGVAIPLEGLRAALDGRHLIGPPASLVPARLVSDAVERGLLEADYRMAHSVGIAPEIAAATMQELWGRSFTAERDRRAGPDANPQKRGRISRELKAELHKAVTDGDD
jgi:hypothetical protein